MDVHLAMVRTQNRRDNMISYWGRDVIRASAMVIDEGADHEPIRITIYTECGKKLEITHEDKVMLDFLVRVLRENYPDHTGFLGSVWYYF